MAGLGARQRCQSGGCGRAALHRGHGRDAASLRCSHRHRPLAAADRRKRDKRLRAIHQPTGGRAGGRGRHGLRERRRRKHLRLRSDERRTALDHQHRRYVEERLPLVERLPAQRPSLHRSRHALRTEVRSHAGPGGIARCRQRRRCRNVVARSEPRPGRRCLDAAGVRRAHRRASPT